MKIGLKFFSHDGFEELQKFVGLIDYAELMIVPGDDFSRYKDVDTKFTIHAPHCGQGVNPADRSLEKFNFKAVSQTIKAADLLDADVIVMHAGDILSNNLDTTKENALNFLKQFNEPRFHIENLPVLDDNNFLCTEPYETKQFISGLNSKFCFDFCHATITANSFGISYKSFINDFINSIRPDYLHMADMIAHESLDSHLSLGKGTLDLDFVKQKVRELDLPVTLETPNGVESRTRDIEFLRK